MKLAISLIIIGLLGITLVYLSSLDKKLYAECLQLHSEQVCINYIR